MLSRIIQRITNYFFQNIVSMIFKDEKRTGPVETRIIKIINRHYVEIKPTLTPEKTEALTKQIMYLPNQDARTPYRFFSRITNINFFLDKNDDKALQARRKIISYLNPRKINVDFFQEMTNLFCQMLQTSKDPNNLIIKKFMLKLLMQTLAGINLSNSMCDAMLKLDVIENPLLCLAYLYLPKMLLRLIPSIRYFENECEKNIQLLMCQQIKELRDQKQIERGTWFADVLLDKLNKKDISKLTEREINQLAKDSDLRMCLGVVLGVSNISRTLWHGLEILFGSIVLPILAKLQYEIREKIKDSYFVITKENMPILHAIYLETLRHATKSFGIMRYSRNGFETEDLTIPPRSFINLLIDSASRASNLFEPERYLDERNQLNHLAVLHQGLFTPFGVGERMCPGVRITEDIIKRTIIAFAMNVTYTNGYTLCLNPDGENRVKASLVKNSLFRYVEASEEQIDKVVKVVMSYS